GCHSGRGQEPLKRPAHGIVVVYNVDDRLNRHGFRCPHRNGRGAIDGPPPRVRLVAEFAPFSLRDQPVATPAAPPAEPPCCRAWSPRSDASRSSSSAIASSVNASGSGGE